MDYTSMIMWTKLLEYHCLDARHMLVWFFGLFSYEKIWCDM